MSGYRPIGDELAGNLQESPQKLIAGFSVAALYVLQISAECTCMV